MTCALDSRPRGLGSRPDQVLVLCSWARHSTLPMPYYTVQMDAAKLSGKFDEMLGDNLVMD